MAAGGSAAEQAHRKRLNALKHEQQASWLREEADRYELAAETERRIVAQLSRLVPDGFHVLPDRVWPGSKAANVDCVVVGRGGVFIVDPKCWADVSVAPGRITRRGEDVTRELAHLSDLAETTRTVLADVGLPPREVHVIAVLAGWGELSTEVNGVEVLGERALLRRIASAGERLSADQVDEILTACVQLFPAKPSSTVPPQRAPRTGKAADPAQLDFLSAGELRQALMDGVQGKPIEDWMTFLHPDQARLVRRTLAGPARVRGAAGTGKTVVGLHRAAWLAQNKPGRILVTGFVKTLPAVLDSLYQRMAPETVGQVDFMGLHAIAMRMGLRGERVDIPVDGGRLEFERAWSYVAVNGPLARSTLDREYWREEIDWVIKGRGLTDFDSYAELRRVGRRYRISPEQRVAVWELYLAYQRCLAAKGQLDFNDVLIRAEAAARRGRPGSRYASVIVDEVQDLTCVGLRFLYALVGDAPDGLLLVGDGQQAIYPGGYTLAEVGIDVRGRSSVLRRNYRNTVEILNAAQQVVAADVFSDLDDLEELGERDVEVIRHGEEPVFVVERSPQRLKEALLRELERVRMLPGVGLGDIAVLVPHHRDEVTHREMLTRHGVPVMALADYRGRVDQRVKVGTYHRAKGLDFKHVLLPRWDTLSVSRESGESDAAHRERVERERRTLFVAMTRARDGLWLGRVG